jgi:hypothetical protein
MRFRENDHINNTYLTVLKEQRTLKEDLGDPHDVNIKDVRQYDKGPQKNPNDFKAFLQAVVSYYEAVLQKTIEDDEDNIHGFDATEVNADIVQQLNNAKSVADVAEIFTDNLPMEYEDALYCIIEIVSKFNLKGFLY